MRGRLAMSRHTHPPEAAAERSSSASAGDPPARTSGRMAYFDCFAGISGDMTLGALIDAGVDEAELRRGLQSLGLPGWELRTRQVQRHAITATDIEIIDRQAPPQTEDGRTTEAHSAHS